MKIEQIEPRFKPIKIILENEAELAVIYTLTGNRKILEVFPLLKKLQTGLTPFVLQIVEEKINIFRELRRRLDKIICIR